VFDYSHLVIGHSASWAVAQNSTTTNKCSIQSQLRHPGTDFPPTADTQIPYVCDVLTNNSAHVTKMTMKFSQSRTNFLEFFGIWRSCFSLMRVDAEQLFIVFSQFHANNRRAGMIKAIGMHLGN